MSAVSLVRAVPMGGRFPAAHGAGLARRAYQGLAARAVSYPDQFARRAPYPRLRTAAVR